MRCFGKIVRIKLGDIGEGTKEAKIKKWHVEVGQRIKEVCISINKLLSLRTFVTLKQIRLLQRFHQPMMGSSKSLTSILMKFAV